MAAGNKDDPKVRALRETRSLNPRAEAVSDPAFAASEFLDARDLVQVKYEMVRRVRVEGEQVARAADAFGFSRQSLYATQAALDEGGLPALVPQRPGPKRAHKLSEEVLAFCQQRLRSDPKLKPRDLVAQITERFDVRCIPARSSALSPARRRALGARKVTEGIEHVGAEVNASYEPPARRRAGRPARRIPARARRARHARRGGLDRSGQLAPSAGTEGQRALSSTGRRGGGAAERPQARRRARADDARPRCLNFTETSKRTRPE